MRNCDHCLLEFSESDAVHETIAGQEKVFCCHGCRGIARLISDEGLDAFYIRRDSSWTPGPPEDNTIDPSVFTDGLKQEDGKTEADIILDGIRCSSCIWLIEKILLKTEGVIYAKVNYATHRAKIRWLSAVTDIGRIAARIQAAGYTPKPFIAGPHEEELRRQQRDLLVRFGTAAFFSMQLMMYSVALYAGYFQGISEGTKRALQLLSLLLATPVVFYSGMPFAKGAARGIRNLAFNMDVLIVTGAGSAYVYSIYQIIAGGEVYFDTAAMIITLLLLGRYIETEAKGRASQVITGLLSLNPKEARVIRPGSGRNRPESGVTSESTRIGDQGKHNNTPDEKFEIVPISLIKENDLVQVQPGERVPLDGIVTEGVSEVDESMLTGESSPVAKTAGSEVFCGTQNLNGNMVFQVSRAGGDTVLSRIVKAVEDAQARQAPVQALADRVAGYFVPAVLLLSLITGLAWFFHGSDMDIVIMTAISVLVIACPCALGLATPLAVLIGTAGSVSEGILIRGGDIIEKAAHINTVVLDKTGTITEGRPEIVSYRGIGVPDKEALRIAYSLEKLSEHSISGAILQAAKEMKAYDVAEFTACPGRGVRGSIDGKDAVLGSRDFIETEGICSSIETVLGTEHRSRIHADGQSGATVIYLSYDRKMTGFFAVSDRTRKEAGEAVELLKDMGNDVIMITGDSMNTAAAVARAVNLGEGKVMARLSPLQKAVAIEEMQKKGRKVIMAGDGINDAPALVQADVGIAVGRATDIALESADMVLMRDDLRLVADAVMRSRKIYSVIRQNLFWAFVYNIIALPLAVSGMLHPVVAAIAMTLSSLSVVGNSMRLRRT